MDAQDERVAPMQRLAALALLAGLLLAGCQSEPSQAAAVGDVTISHDEVDATAAAYEAASAAAAQPGQQFGNGDRAFLRQYVVQATIFNEVARRYAQEQSIPAPQPNYAETANRLRLTENDRFVRIVADNEAYRSLLLGRAQSAQPTEDDMRDAYNRYVKAARGAGVEPVSYDEIRQELVATPQYSAGIGLRNALAEAAQRYGISVSPRYQPLEVPIWAPPQSQLVLVALLLGEQGDAVRDLD